MKKIFWKMRILEKFRELNNKYIVTNYITMKTKIFPILTLLLALTPLPALAHAGHNHSDGLHQTIGIVAIALLIVIPAGVYAIWKRKKIRD